MTTDNIESWSETASSNADIGGAPVAEGAMFVPHINNALRNIMSQVAKWTGADTIASATTTDLSTVQGQYVSVTGTTTITGLGTVKAGWIKMLVFSDALTFTHNATSLILPGGASITTAAGDAAFMLSLGSGNWKCIAYTKADGSSIAGSTSASTSTAGVSEFATAAEFRTGTDTGRSLVVDQVWTSAEPVTLTDAATIAVDMSTFINGVVTLGGNRELGQPSNTKNGQCGFIRIIQDGTGNRTLSYHSDWQFANGTAPVLSTGAGDVDVLFYQQLAANYTYATLVKDLG